MFLLEGQAAHCAALKERMKVGKLQEWLGGDHEEALMHDEQGALLAGSDQYRPELEVSTLGPQIGLSRITTCLCCLTSFLISPAFLFLSPCSWVRKGWGLYPDFPSVIFLFDFSYPLPWIALAGGCSGGPLPGHKAFLFSWEPRRTLHEYAEGFHLHEIVIHA